MSLSFGTNRKFAFKNGAGHAEKDRKVRDLKCGQSGEVKKHALSKETCLEPAWPAWPLCMAKALGKFILNAVRACAAGVDLRAHERCAVGRLLRPLGDSKTRR
jgi:hypothetical protein